jgi:raffinose/stachyose/melibiose transport system substrate-binding protein
MKMKNNVVRGLCISTVIGFGLVSALAGCGSDKNEAGSSAKPSAGTAASPSDSKEAPVKLTFLQWTNSLIADNGTVDIIAEYKKVKPNVTIEIQTVKDSGEFEQTLKIRRAANEMPDIFPLKPYMLSNFADTLADLSDVPAAADNLYAKQYAVNGKVVGLPLTSFNEFVWYSKKIFKEYNLSVPKTWNEFIDVAQKIKAGGKYTPILMGGKDTWPVYPFNEFMPSLIANDGNYWNVMATQDEPFTKDKPFYQAYSKIKQLYDAKVMGPDPLGVGFDQVKTMFSTKGAMIAAGQWYYGDAKKADADANDIGAFLLPVRDRADDKLNTVTMVDSFLATSKNNKHLKEVKEFINWCFTNEKVYKSFTRDSNSTLSTIKADVPAPVKEAFEGVNVNPVLYDGGNADFQKIQAAISFDVKKLGQEMMAGKDLDKMMEELNKSWKKAKGK